MCPESLLARLAQLASPYQEKSRRIKQSAVANSVFEIAMGYLSTRRRTSAIDAAYGVESTSFLYAVLRSENRLRYFKSIENGLLHNDVRLASAVVQDKSYRHATNGIVQYLDILLTIKDSSDAGDDPLAVRIACDFAGSIFRVKYE